MSTHKGGCLCGAVTYEIHGSHTRAVACHCGQCRKTSGHYWAAVQVPNDQFEITGDTGLTWFQSSEKARRGFCRTCGSSLFWEMDGEGATSIAAGSLEVPSGLKLASHIFVADKGDYYDLADDLPQKDRF
jgi:hypothetical protein